MWDRALPDLQPVCAAYGLLPLQHTWDIADRSTRVLQMTSAAFDGHRPAGTGRAAAPQRLTTMYVPLLWTLPLPSSLA